MGITRRRQRSQVLIVFAITVTAILAVIGLLYTFGLVLAQRRTLQTAADAGSLRGSWQVLQELASDDLVDAQVMSEVVRYAVANGLPSDGTTADTAYLTAWYVDASGVLLSPSVQVGTAAAGKFPFRARGVQVNVTSTVPSVLPGFVKIVSTVVRDSASATGRAIASPALGSLAMPIAVSKTDVQTALANHATYDLFAHSLPVVGSPAPTLDLTSSGALNYGSAATNEQDWSDGNHTGSWQLPQPSTINLANAPYYDSIATGLSANVGRQGLSDLSGAADPAYALVTVPVYDTPTTTTVHVVGFAQFKIRRDHITPTSAPGVFVPYVTAAWGAYSAPAVPDFGAALVSIVS